jgi:hypothetical protein
MGIGSVLVQPQRMRRTRGAKGKGARPGDFATSVTSVISELLGGEE